MHLGPAPSLKFKFGDDVERAWQLQVFVNDKKIVDKLIDGLCASDQSDSRHWEEISIDLTDYKNQTVVLRLYQRVLVPHHEAGNAYWRDLTVQ
jgi:hypothetical protein